MLRYIFFISFLAITLNSKPLILGKTYEFAEQDMLKEIKFHISNSQSKLKKQERKIVKKIKNKILNMKPKVTIELKKAKKNITYPIDTTYETEFDVMDTNGNILYPKGFRYNPLDYIQLPYEIIFINAKNKEELVWAKQYAGNAGYKILITSGTYKNASEALKAHVFFATDHIIKRFQIKVTPTIVAQKKNKMYLTEVFLKANN